MENKCEKPYIWRCRVCGYEFKSDLKELPEDFVCPVCGASRSSFERIDNN